MVNLVKLMPEWNWQQFDQIMRLAGTTHVELVPGMVLGPQWDQQINEPSACTDHLAILTSKYTVTSIQSLTYGLNINLADLLSTNDDVLRRFESLAHLGERLKCRVFVLGSPGQKKLNTLYTDPEAVKQHFIENCAWMASVLAPSGNLSLEHNTKTQGADYCNTLRDVVDTVIALRGKGLCNVGLNLDTKCLIHEFGNDINLDELINTFALESIVASIQVSLDFLIRGGDQARSDEKRLLRLAQDLRCPISLEEFGLINEQLNVLISAWKGARRI